MSISNKPGEVVKREYELEAPVAPAVWNYATFIESTPDHVLRSAPKMAICRDVEFRRRQKQQAPAERKDGHAEAKEARA